MNLQETLMKRLLTTLLVGTVAAFAAASASADDTLLREFRDRVEIEDLMWRYVRSLDTLDADGYAAVFTEDGQFGSGDNATRGRDALRQMVLDLRRGRAENGTLSGPAMYHVIANSRIEFIDENSARMESYWMTVFGPTAPGEAPRVAAVGRGVDDLVRVGGRWLIRKRDVSPGD
jgi:uncharacterized protein (TIGR02246 family)